MVQLQFVFAFPFLQEACHAVFAKTVARVKHSNEVSWNVRRIWESTAVNGRNRGKE
jgi:hypothetical protein